MRRWSGTLLVVALLILPAVWGSQYVLQVLVMATIYAVCTLAISLAFNWTGLISFGQAGYLGIGAYTGALLALKLGWPFWLTIPGALVVGLVVGIVTGFPAMRFVGLYFGLVTMAFSEVFRLLELNWLSLTKGPMGLHSVPRPVLFGTMISDNRGFYLLGLVMLGIAVLAVQYLQRSDFGLAFLAAKDDPVAAAGSGVPVRRVRMLAFAAASGLTAMAGAFMSHFLTVVHPVLFGWNRSLLILTMALLSGRSAVGAIVSALILTGVPELLRMTPEFQSIAYGAILLGLILYYPEDPAQLGKWLRETVNRRRGGRKGSEALAREGGHSQ